MGVVKRPYSRRNGWSWPPHPFQFIAWGCFILFIVLHFTTICPELQQKWRIPVYIIAAVLFLVHFVVHIVACSVNPADSNVKMKGRQTAALPVLDRSKHAHAIENQHCYLCEVDVTSTAKHCSACNKCVSGFDHHCKWLNNCVGDQNYRLFIATIATALVGSLFLISFCLLLFVAYFTDQTRGHILQTYHDVLRASQETSSTSIPLNASSSLSFRVSAVMTSTASSQSDDSHLVEFRLCYAVVPDAVWLSVMMISAFLNLIAIGLLLHLLCFHVFLMYKGLSTYGFIVAGRKRDEEAARNQALKNNSFAGLECAKPGKSNQIVPHVDDDVYEQPAHRLDTLPRSVTPPLPVFLTPTRVRKEMNGVNSHNPPPTPPPVDFMQPMIPRSELANGHLRPLKMSSKRKRSKHQHRKARVNKDTKDDSDMATAGSISGVSLRLPSATKTTTRPLTGTMGVSGTWSHTPPRPLPQAPGMHDPDSKSRSLPRSVSNPGSRPSLPRWPSADSVESLHEIPIHTTRAGSLRNAATAMLMNGTASAQQGALSREEIAGWHRTTAAATPTMSAVDVHVEKPAFELVGIENDATLV